MNLYLFFKTGQIAFLENVNEEDYCVVNQAFFAKIRLRFENHFFDMQECYLIKCYQDSNEQQEQNE